MDGGSVSQKCSSPWSLQHPFSRAWLLLGLLFPSCESQHLLLRFTRTPSGFLTVNRDAERIYFHANWNLKIPTAKYLVMIQTHTSTQTPTKNKQVAKHFSKKEKSELILSCNNGILWVSKKKGREEGRNTSLLTTEHLSKFCVWHKPKNNDLKLLKLSPVDILHFICLGSSAATYCLSVSVTWLPESRINLSN